MQLASAFNFNCTWDDAFFLLTEDEDCFSIGLRTGRYLRFVMLYRFFEVHLVLKIMMLIVGGHSRNRVK